MQRQGKHDKNIYRSQAKSKQVKAASKHVDMVTQAGFRRYKARQDKTHLKPKIYQIRIELANKDSEYNIRVHIHARFS